MSCTACHSEKTLAVRLSSFQEFEENNPLFRASTLRRFYRQNTDGFRDCCVPYGRRVFIDLDRFTAWLRRNENHNRAGVQIGA